ncbi:MAG: glutaredoxin 3 [Pseudomonadota bacterium]
MNVVIYSTARCPSCTRAENLLQSKGIAYDKILVDNDIDKRNEMLQRSNGRRTVPQIFINEQHIGGYDDLAELNRSGKLDQLLNQEK